MKYVVLGNYLHMKEETKILKLEPKRQDLLSEDEITKIFLGLMGLMKKSAEYSAIKKVEQIIKKKSDKIDELSRVLEKRTKQLETLLKLGEIKKETL